MRSAALFMDLQLTEQDWQDETPPQAHLNDRVIRLPRGKVLGGCSNLNCTVYVRGNAENFNGWEREGCEGWGYKDVLPYFKKAENIMCVTAQRCCCACTHPSLIHTSATHVYPQGAVSGWIQVPWQGRPCECHNHAGTELHQPDDRGVHRRLSRGWHSCERRLQRRLPSRRRPDPGEWPYMLGPTTLPLAPSGSHVRWQGGYVVVTVRSRQAVLWRPVHEPPGQAL